jgi:hypothetical protein
MYRHDYYLFNFLKKIEIFNRQCMGLNVSYYS